MRTHNRLLYELSEEPILQTGVHKASDDVPDIYYLFDADHVPRKVT